MNNLLSKIKTKTIIILIPILIFIFILLFGVFKFSEIRNDSYLNKFSSQILNYPLPEKTTLISKSSKVGNFSWTGNSCDFGVVIVVSSELTENELKLYNNNAKFKPALKPDSDRKYKHTIGIDVFLKVNAEHFFSKYLYDLKNENIISESDIKSTKREYIIQFVDSGYPALFDLRCN